MFFSGIDLHKDNLMIATLDDQGIIQRHIKLPTAEDQIKDYFQSLDLPHRAVVESTCNWYWLSDLLRSLGVEMILAHAKYLKAISYAKVKTDKVDALTLAQLLRLNMIPAAHQISPERRPLRDLMRARLRLIYRRTSCVNSLQRILEKFNLRNISDEYFWEKPCPDLSPEFQLYQSDLQDTIRLLENQINQLEKFLHPVLVPNPDIQRLLGVPGIGKISAFTLYLEIDGIERFADPKHFYSYCRLVPGADNSNRKCKHKSGSKDGNKYLKIIFNEIAIKAYQHYPAIRKFYHRCLRLKPKAVARNMVAKELAQCVFYILKNHTEFTTFKGISISKAFEWPRLASPRA